MSWEDHRAWHLMRPLVYYLREDFIPPTWAQGAHVLDFSAGLGDLSHYLASCGATRVVATRPESEVPDPSGVLTWKGGVAAGNIVDSLSQEPFDLIAARMVFQFPTWEGDSADPDTIVEELAQVIRKGGRLVAAFHEYVPFEKVPATGDYPDVDEVLRSTGDYRSDLASVVNYLDLPPREGPFGETGFGLKVPMMITTLQRRGFFVESAEHLEPFTFPLDLDSQDDQQLKVLGEKVMEIKGRYLAIVDMDPYQRPGEIRKMLKDLSRVFRYAAWPIVRVVARYDG